MARHQPVHAGPTSPSPAKALFLVISQLEMVTAVNSSIQSLAEKQGDALHHPAQACLNVPSTPAIRDDAEQPRDSSGIPNHTSMVHGIPALKPTSHVTTRQQQSIGCF